MRASNFYIDTLIKYIGSLNLFFKCSTLTSFLCVSFVIDSCVSNLGFELAPTLLLS